MLALGEHAAFVVARLIAVPLAVAHRGKAQGAGGLGRGVGAFHGKVLVARQLVYLLAAGAELPAPLEIMSNDI